MIYFDIDNTLVDHSYAEKRAISLLLEQYSHDFSYISNDIFVAHFKKINVQFWKRLTLGELTVEELRTQRFAAMLEKFSGHPYHFINELAPILGNKYLENYKSFWQLFNGASQAIESASQIAPLGLLSNGFRLQVLGKIKQFSWDSIFKQVVISEDVGVMKPHGKIFEYAMSVASVSNSSEMLYIGDHYDTDIIGANNAGWQTIWVNLHNEIVNSTVANAEISSISELPERIVNNQIIMTE